jgi:hypothetical protein
VALTDLLKGQELSTEFIDVPVRFRQVLLWLCRSVKPSLCPLQMLRSFVDLACRAIRLDLLKPRVYENDFSGIDMDPHGSIIVNNARYKTRIRASRQVRHT